MGYYLQAFIGKANDIVRIEQAFTLSKVTTLKQDISLIMLTEKLFKQITDSVPSDDIGGFEYLTSKVELKILDAIQNDTIAYIEAEYFGGEGWQSAIIWKNGKRIKEIKLTDNAINSVLDYFGVIAEKGKDEFDTLQFGILKCDTGWESS